MHQTFDSSVPRMEQLLRVANAKRPGRKHQHRPSSRVTEKRKAAARRNLKLLVARHRKHRAAVREYWLGMRDTHP